MSRSDLPMNINELKHNVTAIPGSSGRALMIRDDSHLSVTLTAEAEELKSKALALAAVVPEVITTPEEQEVAVQAQIAIQEARKECENTRQLCKQPVLEFGRRIDALAKSYCAPLDEAMEQVSAPLRDFQAAEDARKRAAEALQLAELTKLERKRQQELAAATTIEKIDEIQHRINDEVRAASVPIEAPPKAKGQCVGWDWEIVVPNPHLLAKERPDCVRIEPDLRAIKDLLNAGVEIRSIQAKRVLNSTVRTGRGKVLDLIQ